MSLIKIRLSLTTEQKEQGIRFISTLSREQIEQEADTAHTVYWSEENKNAKINRLENSQFFNKSHFKYNIIRE